MDYSLPHRIKNERDLQIYEDFIKREDTDCTQTTAVPTIQNRQSGLMPAEKSPQNRTAIMQYTALTDNTFFYGYLKNHRGKLIKAESLIGGRLESRIGILLEIGNDYIVIKLPRSNCTMMIKTAAIKYVTIVHDNDMSKTY